MAACLLCEAEKDLVNSHVIPKFVFSWLKETSPSHIREYNTPNLRVQDGLKFPMLCPDCELRLSGWESEFSKNVFSPIHDTRARQPRYPYGPWALKFAVSVSWRILMYGASRGISHFSGEQLLKVDEALGAWRAFILDQAPHPGEFQQHVIVLDLIASHTLPEISGYMNRYLLRSVDMDIIASESRAYVYAKMGRVMLLGTIQEPHPRRWRGTKLHVRGGSVGSKKYVTPFALDEYLNYRANKVGEAWESLSEQQAQKIRYLQTERRAQFINSEVFQAIKQDVLLSGEKAFDARGPDEQRTPGA